MAYIKIGPFFTACPVIAGTTHTVFKAMGTKLWSYARYAQNEKVKLRGGQL